jgi:hypothetical protein
MQNAAFWLLFVLRLSLWSLTDWQKRAALSKSTCLAVIGMVLSPSISILGNYRVEILGHIALWSLQKY